jgi:hypothetical protein
MMRIAAGLAAVSSAGVAMAIQLGVLQRQGNLSAQRNLQGRFDHFSELNVELFERLRREAVPLWSPEGPKEKAHLEDYMGFMETLESHMLESGLSGPVIAEDWILNQYGAAINVLVRTPVVHVDMLCRNPDGWRLFLQLAQRNIHYHEQVGRAPRAGHEETKGVLQRLQKCAGRDSEEFRRWQSEWTEASRR